ncbi:hypothetical protein D9M69_661630 [compost metagenome]
MWSRRVRVLSLRKVSRSAYGLTTAKGLSRRWAFWCRRTMACFSASASRPSRVCFLRCAAWIASVCSRLSLMVSTRQRLSSSSSMSIAVVVSISITGPCTRYCLVTRLPVASSLPVLAMVSSPSDCSSFRA